VAVVYLQAQQELVAQVVAVMAVLEQATQLLVLQTQAVAVAALVVAQVL
jgi:hypothetical protein